MYLKRMELFGFKSFAEKTELEFNPGIAAVIGPNGCGKSNLVDAVRWALGEQSVKSLRGTRMEEIIFSGSDSRKALNFAEVSLTFSGSAEFLNLEYDEVTITRRLFRSGDSEYYINKSPCRLRDITELFLDTGLGKDAYSVIGQGRVEEIINSRPEERREIFEEAAGIFKYKLRKKEARRRLEETKENLVRVQDLVFELETQIEPLQEQAEVTRRYRALRGQVEIEEKLLLSHQLQQTKEKLAKIEKQLQTVNDALLSSASKGGLREKEYQDLKEKEHEQRALLAASEQKLQAFTRSLEQHESELRILVERESRFREQLAQGEQRIRHLDQLAGQLAGQKTATEEELAAKELQADAEEEQYNKLKQQLQDLEKSPLAAEVGEQQDQLYRAAARKESHLSALEELRERLVLLEERKLELQKDSVAIEEEGQKYLEQAEIISARAVELQSQLGQAAATEANASEARDRAAAKQKEAAAEEQKKREALHGLNSRLGLLKEQQSSLTGYYRGVREVMQAKISLPGLIGPVADLIRVDEAYIQAVETALGGSLQHIVTKTEQAAHQAIRHLKSKNGGWATFLPLDVIHSSADPLARFPGWDKLEGVIGRASDLAKTDSAYRKIIEYALSSIIVCRSLEDASRAAKFVRHSCRVVTLDGEIINPGGSIRGGSLPKRNAGMPLGRRREIEELEGEQAKAEAELKKAADNLSTADDQLNEAVKNLEISQSERLSRSEALKGMQQQLEIARRDQRVAADRLTAREADLRRLQDEQGALKKRAGGLKEQIEAAGIEIETLEKNLAGKKDSFQQHLDQKKAIENRVTEALVKKNSYREQARNYAAKIEDITGSIDGPSKEKTALLADIAKNKEELEKTVQAQQSEKEAIQKLHSGQAELIASFDELKKESSRIDGALVELEEESRRNQNQVSRQEKRERQLSMEKTGLETELNYQELRFKELFRVLDPVDVGEEYDPEESQQLLLNLKDDVEGLGEVNLGAIEELERLEARINFLNEQQEDLRLGEVELRKVLAEIDQRMEYYFSSAFESINENFGDTFSELFEGGRAMLKLSDKENMLDSGIDIVAQPPGKKLQNITLLSSGEKVLTAIALVFAILRFKPAPFYLLDEVESTLDDANLHRFTGFLKQAAEQNQFILITHRKRTMEESTILYGVTMPEPGVSNLMSLKLEQTPGR